jgi:AraC-like DNA-binding protein
VRESSIGSTLSRHRNSPESFINQSIFLLKAVSDNCHDRQEPESGEASFNAEAFLEKMHPGFHGLELWNVLPDVSFWIKDHLGRFVWINDTLAGQAQLSRSEVVGKRDADCFPNELASIYMHDDAEIVATGKPMLNKPELVMTPVGGVEWRQTTKIPVLNKNGEVFGTSGISRKMARDIPLPPEYAALVKIISHASENLSKGVKIRDLARSVHLSISTLERYIRAHLRIAPNELLRKIKMNRAYQLLSNSTLNISEIAVECGYESVSSFSRAFRHYSGMTPGAYREKNRSQPQQLLGGIYEG